MGKSANFGFCAKLVGARGKRTLIRPITARYMHKKEI